MWVGAGRYTAWCTGKIHDVLCARSEIYLIFRSLKLAGDGFVLISVLILISWTCWRREDVEVDRERWSGGIGWLYIRKGRMAKEKGEAGTRRSNRIISLAVEVENSQCVVKERRRARANVGCEGREGTTSTAQILKPWNG